MADQGQGLNPMLHGMLKTLTDQAPAFRTFLLKRMSDDAAAEDLLQQSFLRALEHEHSIQNQESVVPWFYRILRNAVVDYYRSRAAHVRRAEQFDAEMRVLSEQEVPSLDAMQPAICRCLEPILESLRPQYRDLLRRVDLEGKPIASVATDLKISVPNATVRLHRARRALREQLEGSCGLCTKHGCLDCTCEAPTNPIT